MKQVLEFLVARLRVLFFFAWMYALVELLQDQRYLAFLRPEFGWVLAAALVMFLALTIADLSRPTGSHLRWYEIQRPLILLVPLLFLLNAQGASLDYYTFSKRFTGTAGMTIDIEPSTPATGKTRDKAGKPQKSSVDRSVSSSINPSPEVRVDHSDRKDEEPASSETDGATTGQPSETSPVEAATPEVNVDESGDETGDDTGQAPGGRDITLTELYEAPKLYEGKTVSVIGMSDPNEDVGRQFGEKARVLYRFLISCCAADAQPIALVFETRQLVRTQAQGAWVRVTGRYTLEKKDGRTIPVLRDAVMSTIPKPPDEYLY